MKSMKWQVNLRLPRSQAAKRVLIRANEKVPLDGLFLPGFRRLAFVDQEGPNSATAFTLDNVRWHSIPS